MADSNGKVSSEKVEKKVERPKQAKEKILELNLDNCRNDDILGLAKQYTTLEILSLINTNLSSLKGFPKLPNLKKLRMSDNRVSDGLSYLTTSPKLQTLDLSGNKIKTLKELEPLQELKQLTTLDLFNNEVTQLENYREKVFKMLPSLKFLDGMDSNNAAAPSDEDDDDELNGNDSEDEDSYEELDECDDENDDDSVEDDDMSLTEIYNEDLEEDNSDWEEGEGGEDDDEDEIESDDEDAKDDAKDTSTTSAAVAKELAKNSKKEADADEPTTKKRKTNE